MNLGRLHALAAVVFVGAIMVQVVLAGLAIANLGGSGDFSTHMEFGFTWVGLAALAVVVTAFLTPRKQREVAISFGLFGLYIVQMFLPGFKTDAPQIAALHPLNAMFLFALAVWYARREWLAMSAPAGPMGG